MLRELLIIILTAFFVLQLTVPVTLAVVSALDVPITSAVRVLAMDAMAEPTANVTKTSVLVTKKNNAVLERLKNAQNAVSKCSENIFIKCN